jgi:hypothetical protein
MPRLKLVLITLGIVLALALALVLKLVVFAPKPGEPDWTVAIEPQKPLLVAVPGEFVTQVFELTYIGLVVTGGRATSEAFKEMSCDLSIKAPQGWQVLGLDEVNPIKLKKGESQQVFVTIGVPPRHPPGEYRLRAQPIPSLEEIKHSSQIRTQTPSARLSALVFSFSPIVTFTVRVKRAAIPRVEPRSPRDEAEAGSEMELHFILSNLGNTRGVFKLMTIAPPGWRVALDQKRIELDVSESREVGITVSVPADAPPGVEKVILRATTKGYESEAAVKVTVLPR